LECKTPLRFGSIFLLSASIFEAGDIISWFRADSQI